MKINISFFLLLFFSTAFHGFSQHYDKVNNIEPDHKDYTMPQPVVGFDSLMNCIRYSFIQNDSTTAEINTVYDALISFTLNEKGEISKYKHKGYNYPGADLIMKKCISQTTWTPAKNKISHKYVKSDVNLTFNYVISDGKIKILNKESVFFNNFEKGIKKTEGIFIVLAAFVVLLLLEEYVFMVF